MKLNWKKPPFSIFKANDINSVCFEGIGNDYNKEVAKRRLMPLITSISKKEIPLYYFSSTINKTIDHNVDRLEMLLPNLTPRTTAHILYSHFCVLNEIFKDYSLHYFLNGSTLLDVLKIETEDYEYYKVSSFTEIVKRIPTICNEALRTLISELFLDYAEIETVVIGSSTNKSYRAIIGEEKITSKSGLPVKIIDSKYFRNIVRTEGFKVRGHFRLQPYGPNMSQRKLIWINEFKKEGYM